MTQPGGAGEATAARPARTRDLLIVSILALYVELLLIRWIGTEVNLFAYLQNAILVVCFLGLGIGCLASRRPVNPREYLIPLGVLVLLLSLPPTAAALRKVSSLLTTLGDVNALEALAFEDRASVVWAVPVGLGITFGLMLLVWQVFVPLGRLLGSLLNGDPRPIRAYSVNILGSLLGIGLFVLLGVLQQPPAIWFLVLGGLAGWFVARSREHRLANVLLLLLVVAVPSLVSSDPGAVRVLWSPYQKLVLTKADPGTDFAPYRYFVTVNNTSYQGIMDLSPASLRARPEALTGDQAGLSQYDIPYLVHPRPRRVLIVGAGTGNDVAAALRAGVERVTAVEIDPAIIRWGRAYHPEAPYASERVTVVNDDARSFFAGSKERYDVISFGLLDSHTTTAMTNARLDHYVYTRESIAMARELLAPGGVMTLNFAAHRQFIGDRMARVLREVFAEPPTAFRIPQNAWGYGGLMFIAGDQRAIARRIGENRRLAGLVARWTQAAPERFTYATPATTDDWPYLYLDAPRIPILYVVLGVMLAGLFLYTRWRARGAETLARWTAEHWHFFFLGAAFLLLEVHNISKAAVVLGNTWQVNAVIIAGILAMILLANLVAARWPRLPMALVLAGLIGSCLALYAIDLAAFARLPYAERAAIVGALAAIPVFFSGLVFIRAFAATGARDEALGANLMGSLAGGLLQSVTFITGIKGLLLIVASLYLAAALLRPSPTRAAR